MSYFPIADIAVIIPFFAHIRTATNWNLSLDKMPNRIDFFNPFVNVNDDFLI